MMHGSWVVFLSWCVCPSMPMQFVDVWKHVWVGFTTSDLSCFLEGLRVNGKRLWLRVRRSDCTDQRQRASERGE